MAARQTLQEYDDQQALWKSEWRKTPGTLRSYIQATLFERAQQHEKDANRLPEHQIHVVSMY